MGLCKCPKRRVTTQFCFEHRVNVCEYCMVTNHPRCIVQSYLQWLQDSDYFPICELCTKPLSGEECIRLTCYHVFHWSCAEKHYRSLGRGTAPAGYRCVSCSAPVFPAPNLVSPVADVLRVRLAGVNWARAGLGMPLLSEDQDQKAAIESHGSSSPVDPVYLVEAAGPRAPPLGASDDETGPTPNGSAHSIVQMQEDPIGMYDSTSVKRNDGNQAPRRVFQDINQSHSASNFDHDENKYKGKSTFAWIWRWWKNTWMQSRSRRTSGHLYKRYWLLAAILLVILVLLLLSLSARSPIEDDDPFAALAHNPQQIVAHKN